MLSLLAAICVQIPTQLDQDLGAIIERYRQAANASGILAAVGYNGRVIAASCKGTRSSSLDQPVRMTDSVMIGSVSKPLSAAMIAKCVEEGILRWDTTVVSVFPEVRSSVANSCAEATVEQLLSHRSGLQRAFAPKIAAASNSAADFRYRTVLATYALPPIAAPGATYLYNSGPTIVTAMIEKLTGEKYEELMTRKVFQPLGLKSFTMGRPWTKSKNAVVSEILENQVIKEAPKNWQPQLAFDPSGAWSCTISELVQFGLSETKSAPQPILKPDTVQRMFTAIADGSNGLSWSVSKSKGFLGWGSHGGSTGLGDTSVLFVNPTRNLAFAFYFNRNTDDPGIKDLRDKLCREIQDLIDHQVR